MRRILVAPGDMDAALASRGRMQRAVWRPRSALYPGKLEMDGARRVEVNGFEIIASAEV